MTNSEKVQQLKRVREAIASLQSVELALAQDIQSNPDYSCQPVPQWLLDYEKSCIERSRTV